MSAERTTSGADDGRERASQVSASESSEVDWAVRRPDGRTPALKHYRNSKEEKVPWSQV
jgi:hypothetical protein